jgi:hypothetical protein
MMFQQFSHITHIRSLTYSIYIYALPHVPYDVCALPMCHPHLFLNFIPIFPLQHIPYDVPTVSHGHICSLIVSPYMICNMFLMMFPKFPFVIHLCSLILSNMFCHMFLMIFPKFSYVIYSCSLIFRQYVLQHIPYVVPNSGMDT